MWIVRLAYVGHTRSYVASILIVILGIFAILRPLWTFSRASTSGGRSSATRGFSPEDMSNRIIYGFERSITTTVNDIEHIDPSR